jgi:uncharacterized SAM-binding protein YcdF (DUF218 family)
MGEHRLNRQALAAWAQRLLQLLIFALLGHGLWTAYQIIQAAQLSTPTTSMDAAIVLGAAVWRDQPSPVFAARIDYALELLKTRQVDHLIFTGGLGTDDVLEESYTAARYGINRGVSIDRLSCETTSNTTWGNLVAAAAMMQEHEWHTAAIVSDPLHIHRAMLMAEDLGMQPQPAATPYTRYRSWSSRVPFLLREIFFITQYQIQRVFTFQQEQLPEVGTGDCVIDESSGGGASAQG